MLALLGSRIDSLAIIRRKTPLSADSAFWRRFAEAVIRRPLLYALPVVAVLLGLGIPFLNVQFANPDERALPTDSNARLVAESLQRRLSARPLASDHAGNPQDHPGALKTLAAEVSQMDGVVLVNGSIGNYRTRRTHRPGPAREDSGAAYAFAYLAVDADSDSAQHLVRDIRAKITDKQVEVGGPTATLVDSRTAIADRLPWAIGLIAVCHVHPAVPVHRQRRGADESAVAESAGADRASSASWCGSSRKGTWRRSSDSRPRR